MKHLLYCIFEEETVALPKEWQGAVDLLHAHGLTVALSRAESVASPPPLEKLLEHESVVAWLHQHRSVIPLRYGNVLDSEPAVVEMLARRAQEFHELLARLHGRTELGLRILLGPPPAAPPPSSPPVIRSSPGIAYLHAARLRHQGEGGRNETESQLVDRVRASVRHLDAVLASELRAVPDGRLLFVYLLLPKQNVDECRRSLASFLEDASLKVLLTGPWPPYHSVASRGTAHA